MGGLVYKNLSELKSHDWTKLIAVNKDAPFVTIRAQFTCDHLNRHADLHFLLPQVCQLGCDDRPFVQFDQCHGVGGLHFKTSRGIPHTGEGIHLTFSAESIGCFRFAEGSGLVLGRHLDLQPRSVLMFPMAMYN